MLKEECSVCLVELEAEADNANLIVLVCGHAYCVGCLEGWKDTPDAIKPKGSNFGDLRKYKWARAIRMEGRTVVWQDPWKPHVEFRQYIDYTIVRPPTGMNGLAFLGIPPPPLPRTAFTERHDRQQSDPTSVVLQLDGLATATTVPIAEAAASFDKDGARLPGVIVVDAARRVYEPHGDDSDNPHGIPP